LDGNVPAAVEESALDKKRKEAFPKRMEFNAAE
jgi:hypothetical protein